MGDRRIDWRDAGALGVVAARPEGAEAPLVHAGAGGAVGGHSWTAFFGAERRKTGSIRARSGGRSWLPSRQQAILGRGRRYADGLREIVCEYAMETLADPAAALILNETVGRD